ncbi:ABC transporter permease [Polaromonas sp. SM01]|uniref:ABC transporter permease n=1 Tax=Polaromonas sp. SM01 TaxID=3085630 RepID=UPI0029817AA9|nr:ABC transporter permease [Polaromonas sp. SM01]MDW5442179.1 ABC transporter permease [Polaromonas sp. SM01]
MLSQRLSRLASGALFVALVLAWELLARGSRLSALVLPAPSVIWDALWTGLRSGYFWPHLLHTGSELLLGLAIGTAAGLLGGIVMGESAFLRRLLFPYVVVSQVVPKLALAPLFIVWFGFGMTSTVVITALICFFPLMENMLTGLQQVDPRKLELFRMLGATRLQTLLRLKIPSGLPVILAGFRVAVVLALVGAVVGEFIGGSKGLGALIIASQGMMDTPLMFAVLLLITVLGLLVYQLAIGLERLLLWPHLKNQTRTQT